MGGGVINSVAVAVDNVTLALNAGILQIKDAGVAAQQLAASVMDWVLLETVTCAADASKTTGSLTAYKMYKAIMYLQGSADGYVAVTFNGDTGNHYLGICDANTVRTYYENQANVRLVGLGATYSTAAELIVNGKCGGYGTSGCCIAGGKTTVGTYNGLFFQWYPNSAAQIETIRFAASSGTLTGKIHIFGKDAV